MRPLRTLALAAGAALALCAPAAAAAQPTLAPGQVVQARLGSGDPSLTDRGPFRVYRVQAQAGRRYVVWMNSADFDAYLSLARTVGGITDYIATDDDGGEDTNARLRFSVPTTGTYLIVAQSLGSDGSGAFTLGLDTVQVRPAAVRDLRLGETAQGRLEEGDPEHEDAQGFYHLFRFDGAAGQRVRVRMASDAVTTWTEIGMMDGGAFIPLEAEGGGFGDFLIATLPAAGTYHVRAGGWEPGTYSLTVEERVVVPLRPRPLQRGTDVEGSLGSGDGELDDGRWADAYSFAGRAGERVRVTLRSEDFDAFLFVGRARGDAFEALETDDDGGEGLDARIDFVLPADGEYVIHATTFGGGGEGRYLLRAEP